MFPDSQRLEELYAWPQKSWVRLNLVVNDEGAVFGPDGTSNSLSSRHDREIVKIIRRDAEFVIVGSQTVKAEGWHLPHRGTLGIVSRTRDLPEGCPDESRVVIGTIDEIVTFARTKQRVLCEGGSFVASQLLSRDLVDELFLTMSARESDAHYELPTWLSTSTAIRWELGGVIDDGVQAFTTWRRATT